MKEKNTCIREQADALQIERGKELLSDLTPTLDELTPVLALVGNTVRLQILFLLHQEKKLCVCDLSDILGMTLSAISQHLRKLKDRNLLETERSGQIIFYSIAPEHESILLPLFQLITRKKK